MSGVGPPFPPAAQWSTAGRPIGPAPWLLSLLGRACQRLWLGHGYDVYQRFTCVGLAALPWSFAAWHSRLRLLLTDPPTYTGGTFPRSFAYRLTPAGRYQPLRPGREQLVEQLVSSSHKHLVVRQRTRATFRSHTGSRDTHLHPFSSAKSAETWLKLTIPSGPIRHPQGWHTDTRTEHPTRPAQWQRPGRVEKQPPAHPLEEGVEPQGYLFPDPLASMLHRPLRPEQAVPTPVADSRPPTHRWRSRRGG